MIASMTGYGRGERTANGIAVVVEVRSVNSRFLEIASRLPRSLSLRENEIKELVREKISRGKISLVTTVERENNAELPLRVNISAARTYYKLLNQLRKAVKLKEPVKLDHLLKFSEVIEQGEIENTDEQEWRVFRDALEKEGAELRKDFEERIRGLEQKIDQIQEHSRLQIPAERERLRERVAQLVSSESVDQGRLEMELALLADRLDVTEECVRFRSHNKFFLEALRSEDAAGRKLNFLVQEMNREANTIGSKSSLTEISHLIVSVKEELEKIREQLQNIE
jgi:uncharacterized protein (TIGR00255 family)